MDDFMKYDPTKLLCCSFRFLTNKELNRSRVNTPTKPPSHQATKAKGNWTY